MPDFVNLFVFDEHEVCGSDREPWFLIDYKKIFIKIGWKTKKLWWFSENFEKFSKIWRKSRFFKIFRDFENQRKINENHDFSKSRKISKFFDFLQILKNFQNFRKIIITFLFFNRFSYIFFYKPLGIMVLYRSSEPHEPQIKRALWNLAFSQKRPKSTCLF